jgi:sialic acid synthase SpsE
MKPLKPYLIAETAYNHEGDIDYLYRMTDEIAEMKMDAIKYHLMLDAESYMQKNHPLIEDDKKWLFSELQWTDLLTHAQKQNLDIVALCDDVESLEFINQDFKDIFAVEIHATGLNDYFLLNEAANFQGMVILGVGGSTMEEIEYAINLLNKKSKNEILLMYGFQSYPTKYEDVNLLKIKKLEAVFGLPVGYADHTAYNDPNNEFISVMATTMGINILEKHFTPDYGVERIDFHSAVGKTQMLKIKELMNIACAIYGDGNIGMSEAELNYGNTGPMKKAIVAKKEIKAGEKLTLENLWFKRTIEQTPIKQYSFPQLLGLKAINDIAEDEIIDFSKVKYEFKKMSLTDFTNINK